ncbi:MAG: hypothetical protein RRY12_12835 [Cloacibacillus sp.]
MIKTSLFLIRRRGFALLGIVLIGFIVLSIVSAVAMNIAWQTVRVEAWQTQNIQRRRLDAVARSAANAVAETISADKGLTRFGSAESLKAGVTSLATQIFNDPEKTWLTLGVSGTSSSDYAITAVASPDSGKKLELTLIMTLSGDKPVKTWSSGK